MAEAQPSDVGSDAEAGANQPGLGELREAVANHFRRRLPGVATLRRDGLAGLSSAVSNVPDGMANAVLVGVAPVYGLYATTMGPGVGGIVSSTQLMVITTTAAASLSARQALADVPDAERASALAMLVLLAGAFQVLFGLLRMGRLIRFVSYSVTTGFLTGVSVLLVLNQLPIITGYAPPGDNRIVQALGLLASPGQINLSSVAMAGLTLALAVALPRTPLGNAGRLVAIIIPSVLVALLRLDGVQVVRDLGEIPSGVPIPSLPLLSALTLDVVTGALAMAAVILVQGAGVSQSVPNPDDSRRSLSRDFIAQGTANAASGMVGGLPVGGSLSATALNIVYGAQSRWAAVLAGAWMAVIVVVFPGVVSRIAMPALGALLVLAGVQGVKPAELRSIWMIGWPSRLASATTFLATLFLPIQVAVGIGVALSALLNLYSASTDVSLVELVKRPDGLIEEREPPKRLPSNAVTVLDVYGNLFYAGARTLERLLPAPGDARNPVVILRLRGRTHVGATLVEVLSGYVRKLAAGDGRLYLTGIGEAAYDELAGAGKLRLSGPTRTYEATPVRGESTRAAYEDAQAWLVGLGEQAGDAPNGASSGASG